ncbi:MAG: DUF6161 domain-containing protein [Candidatus Kapabacteria bacterium]|nr:DUF6161 domain-containing protein [Candidatus Kapabacteria bacterium]
MSESNNDNIYTEISLEIIYLSPGKPILLYGYESIKIHILQEYNYWINIRDYYKPPYTDIIQHVCEHYDIWSKLIDEIDSLIKNNDPNPFLPFQKQINLFIKGQTRDGHKLIYSKESVAEFIKTEYLYNKQRGNGAYQFISSDSVPWINDGDFNIGVLHASLFLDPGLKTLLSDIDYINLENKITEFNKIYPLFEKMEYISTEKIDLLLNEQKERLFELYNRSKENIVNLERTYGDLLKLKEPIKYWEDKRKKHNKSGIIWSCITGSISLSLIILLIIIFYTLPNYLINSSDHFSIIKGTIIFMTIISFSVFLISIFSKIMLSNFHLEKDAEERQVLTHVFLALLQGGDVNEKERALVLQSIFSRAETGLLKGDSSPSMPSSSSIIEQISKLISQKP